MNKSEENLEKKYKTLFEAAPDAVAFVDSDGTIREVNQKACESLKCSKEDLIGMPLKEQPFYSGEDREKFLERVGRVLKGESLSPETYEVETANGEKRYVEAEHSIVREDDESLGLIIIGRDITNRKEAKEEKEFLNALLRQDLRSKCQEMEGYLQLVEDINLPEEDKENLEKALRSAREAEEIIEMAKKLGEIKETEWISSKNILKILNNITDSISDLAEERGVRIEENYPDSIGKARGNHSLNDLFSQILKIRIQTSNCDEIKLSADKRGGKIFVSVEDNGERLPEKVKNLFSGRVYTGDTTGIGGFRYYMIRKIAEQNNATVEVKDSEMGGARFEVYLEKS